MMLKMELATLKLEKEAEREKRISAELKLKLEKATAAEHAALVHAVKECGAEVEKLKLYAHLDRKVWKMRIERMEKEMKMAMKRIAPAPEKVSIDSSRKCMDNHPLFRPFSSWK